MLAWIEEADNYVNSWKFFISYGHFIDDLFWGFTLLTVTAIAIMLSNWLLKSNLNSELQYMKEHPYKTLLINIVVLTIFCCLAHMLRHTGGNEIITWRP